MESNTDVNDVDFVENQYLGFNKFNLIVRMVIAAACFFSFFTSAKSSMKDTTLNVFLILGISILVISIFLFFVLHIRTLIIGNYVILSGYWNARIIKLDINNIKSCNKVKYSKFLLNRPVYNLNIRGRIKFYTMGSWAVELEDKQGFKYLIGSQKSEQLEKIINKKLKS